MKLYSWNVNGIRAVLRKGLFQPFMEAHKPDILCLQETKAERGQIEIELPGYHESWNSALKKGYSGTAIFSREKPISVVNGFPARFSRRFKFADELQRDSAAEGRVISAEFADFHVVTVYTPNAKDDLSRLALRHKHWDPAFLAYCQHLEKTKPVIFCGDLNVAHTELDLANPAANKGRKGFSAEEREGFQNLLEAGFVDTFRMFKQGKGHYSWWSNFANSRARNVGWRIDYFLVSSGLKRKVKSAAIHADVMGSDHCPVSPGPQMKTFHCTHCQQLLFFENHRCLNCGHSLAYLPDRNMMAAIDQGVDELWRVEGEPVGGQAYRLCANYDQGNICNWAVPAEDPQALCVSCRLTGVIPDLSQHGNPVAWYRLEAAKRRLVYTLLAFRLPLLRKESPEDTGVEFRFLEDSATGDGSRVLTGHDNGVITINVDEADDVRRERQRLQQNEQYRTLLGHFRHEIGHYYWDRLIQDSPRLDSFRRTFGDEREDYQQALQRHYEKGPPANWEKNYISAYASCHPWEDWAESWAHLMHMTDALETAAAVGLSLQPKRKDEPSMTTPPDPLAPRTHDFNRMVDDWLPLTYVLNNLNRGLGLGDSYPFVLSAAVVEKLRFIHATIYGGG